MRAVRLATITFTLSLACLAGGCMTAPWVPAEPAFRDDAHRYTVELPQGWVRYTQNRDRDVLVTKDGPRLQHVFIERVPVDSPLSHTKKRLARGMIPQEAAEVILDNIGSNERLTGFEVRENRPARVGGAPGFRAVVTYKTKDGLRMKSVVYGTLVGDALYVIKYAAPQRYYFDRDAAAFEKVAQSFKLESI
jgi:hypothetical protein